VATQVFDDGSTITTDAFGNVVGVTPATGGGSSMPESATSGDFLSTILYGVRRSIDAHFAPAPVAQPAYVLPGGFSLGAGIMPLVLVGIAALLVYKFAK